MLSVYFWLVSAILWLREEAKNIVPVRIQRLCVDENGDLTTTISWIIGIAVIAGVGYAVYNNIISPNLTSTTTKTNNLVSSLP